jgi:hypothetical protein
MLLPMKPPEQCADDAQDHGDEPSAALAARKDQLGDRAGNEAENKKCEEMQHEVLLE